MIFINENRVIHEETLLSFGETFGVGGDLLNKYRLYQLLYSENHLSVSAVQGCPLEGTTLWMIALAELRQMKEAKLPQDILYLKEYIPANPKALWGEKEEVLYHSFCHESEAVFLKKLVNYYHRYGIGDLAFYPFFRWEGQRLHPVTHPDMVEMKELLGYEDQKRQVCDNTEAFLAGAQGNNILLYGERGTGKSSTVKALGHRYFSKGLRIVEPERNDLSSLPQLYRHLEKTGLHFIIYIDDLSFEDTETDYKALKAVLEGSLEAKSSNVLIYATSNRRHLVKETWKQRKEDEINVRESQDEVLSLSHRFGLSISFFSPDREDFLTMVQDIAKRRNLQIPPEKMREKALLWTRWQQGLSGRTAVQFVNELEVGMISAVEER